MNTLRLEKIIETVESNKVNSIESVNKSWALKCDNLEADIANNVNTIEELNNDISMLKSQISENLKTIETLKSLNSNVEASKDAYNQLSQQVVKLKEAYFMREDQFKVYYL